MVTENTLACRPNEAGRRLGTSRDTIFKLIASGELRSCKVGSARLIPVAELEAYLARKLEEATA